MLILSIIAFCWIIWLIFETGRLILRWILAAEFSPAAAWLSLTFGLGTWSLGIFAVGAMHVFTPAVVFSICVILTAIFIFLRTRQARNRETPGAPNKESRSCRKRDWLLWVLILVPCLVTLGGALAPEVRGDSIIYHISASLLFCINKGHVEIPSSALTYIPQNQQLLYALGLTLGSDSAAKLFHWTAGVLLLVGTFSVARALGLQNRPALAAAALVALFPVWTYLATATMIDLAVANYILAGVYLICPWSGQELNFRRTLAASVLFGFAFGCKYTAAVVGLVPAFIVAAILPGNRRALHLLVGAFAIALAVFSPWAIRNFLWTGNPIAPTLMRVLGPPGVPETTLTWPDIQPGNPALFAQPINLARFYWETFWSLGNFGYHLPLITLALGGLCAAISGRRTCFLSPVCFLTGFVVLSFLLGAPLGAVRSDSRYVMAHIAVMAALSAYWGSAFLHQFPNYNRRLRLVVTAAFAALFLTWINSTRHRFSELNESLLPVIPSSAREDYLRQRLQRYDANMVVSGAGLNPKSKVLGASYPARVHYILHGTPLRRELIIQNPSELKTANQLQQVQRCGVQYLFGEVSPEIQSLTETAGEFAEVPLYRIR